MEKYISEGTPKTPAINFDLNTGTLDMKGRSIPENSIEFYQPLIDALTLYSAKVKSATNVTMHFVYYTTSSLKCILEIFRKLEDIRKAGNAVSINWLYESEDQDMLEAGEDFQTMINLPFKMVPVNE